MYVPVAIGARGVEIRCSRCMAVGGVAHAPILPWIPQVGAVDAREPFQRFPVQIRQRDGSYRETEVGSLSQMRRIEAQTEQAARNGEGEAMRFRMWSHDHGQGDQNSFGPDPATAARADLARARAALPTRRHGSRLTARRGDGVATLGPGVTEDSASPFAVLP